MSDTYVEILLVEDNPDDEELAVTALRDNRLANAIQVVRDGAQALDYLALCTPAAGAPNRACIPRLVLLDLKLPKVSGLEVLRYIKGNAALRTVPVVIMTSSREERDLIESYQLGANSYIVKPVTFEKFVETVRRIGLYWLLLNQPAPPVSHWGAP